MSLIITFQSRVFTIPMECDSLEHMKPYLFCQKFFDKGYDFCLTNTLKYLSKCKDEIKRINYTPYNQLIDLSDDYTIFLIYLYTLSKLDTSGKFGISFIYNMFVKGGEEGELTCDVL